MPYHRIEAIEPVWARSVLGLNSNGNRAQLTPLESNSHIQGMSQESSYTCLGCEEEFSRYQEAMNHLKEVYAPDEHQLSFMVFKDGRASAVLSKLKTELDSIAGESPGTVTELSETIETLLANTAVEFWFQGEVVDPETIEVEVQIIIRAERGSKYDTFNPPAQFTHYECDYTDALVDEISRLLRLLGEPETQDRVYNRTGSTVLEFHGGAMVDYEPRNESETETNHLTTLKG